jgi:serine/threonine-protein kinase ATR
MRPWSSLGVNLAGMFLTPVDHKHYIPAANRGRISNDDELNIVLLRLVAYLGHSNPVISGVAFNEVIV